MLPLLRPSVSECSVSLNTTTAGRTVRRLHLESVGSQWAADSGGECSACCLTMDCSIPLTEMSNSKNKPSDLEAQQDQGSVLSGVSKDSFEEERGVTCTDIKLIMPTVLILLFTLFIMVTVIPYAFSSVIKQLQAVWALEEQSQSVKIN